MIEPATITTPRLVLRPYTLDDCEELAHAINRREIYETTLNIASPYTPAHARTYISGNDEARRTERDLPCAIALKETGAIVGGIGLIVDRAMDRAELGYWVAVPHWGRGYATEAARALIRHGFDVLKLNCIEAHHLAFNPASGRVMLKAGMKYEGRLRQRAKKDGQYHDIDMYSILRSEYEDSM